MSLSLAQKKLLQQDIKLLKPDFYQFTTALHQNISTRKLTMAVPEQESITKRSFILYCALSKIVNNLDNILQVTPFIQYLANNLSFMKVTADDVCQLCDAFIETRLLFLHNENCQLQQAWQLAVHIFSSIARNYLFSHSNVVSINAYNLTHKAHN